MSRVKELIPFLILLTLHFLSYDVLTVTVYWVRFSCFKLIAPTSSHKEREEKLITKTKMCSNISILSKQIVTLVFVSYFIHC